MARPVQRRAKRLVINGEKKVREPPRVIDPTPGCRFRWRCPLAIDECHSVTPALRELVPGHSAACHVARADAATEAFR